MKREELVALWSERMDQHANSQMTVKKWCYFEGISVNQFYYWKRRLSSSSLPPACQDIWQTVSVIDYPPSASLTIHIAGASIEIVEGFDPDLLRAVITALSILPC